MSLLMRVLLAGRFLLRDQRSADGWAARAGGVPGQKRILRVREVPAGFPGFPGFPGEQRPALSVGPPAHFGWEADLRHGGVNKGVLEPGRCDGIFGSFTSDF